jgi:hypothetical protein
MHHRVLRLIEVHGAYQHRCARNIVPCHTGIRCPDRQGGDRRLGDKDSSGRYCTGSVRASTLLESASSKSISPMSSLGRVSNVSCSL